MKCALTTAACTAILASTAACATTPPEFNPDGLSNVQLTRVTQICQTVVGLNPNERLIGGEWRGQGDHLDYWTSHYRGCVTSLSDSMMDISDGHATAQADHECRARGYTSGSSDLALCVLQSKTRLHETPEAENAATLPLPSASGSLFYARAGETRRREQLACAALGLEPASTSYTSCVKSLNATFFAIDNPIT